VSAPRSALPVLALTLLAGAPVSAATTLDELSWSPDGTVLAGVANDGAHSELRLYDTTTGALRSTLGLDRATAHDGSRIPAIDRFELASAGERVLLAAGDDLYLWRPADHQVRRLTHSAAHELEARITLDGSRVAFVRDREVWEIDLDGDGERRVTTDGEAGGVGNGVLSDQLRQRLGIPDEPALRWSEDGQRVLFLREEPVMAEAAPSEPASRLDSAVTGAVARSSDSDPTPSPEPLPAATRLRVGVADVLARTTGVLDTGDEGAPVRASWRFDGRAVGVERLSDDHDQINLLLCQPDRLYCRPLASAAHSPGYDVADSLRFLARGFLWAQESRGLRTLDLFDTLGRQRARLLPADWELVSVLAVDDLARTATVLALAATGPDRGRRGVLEISWEGRPLRLLASGDDEVLPAPRGRLWVHGWRDADGMRHRVLATYDGAQITDLPPSGHADDGISSEEIP